MTGHVRSLTDSIPESYPHAQAEITSNRCMIMEERSSSHAERSPSSRLHLSSGTRFGSLCTIGTLAKIIGKLISRRRPRPEAAAKPPSRSPC